MTGAAEPGGLGAPRADSCHSPGHYQPVKQSIPHLADALRDHLIAGFQIT
jgi:hypothetical protein